jgi:D-methionine transport system substrate-binding protein
LADLGLVTIKDGVDPKAAMDKDVITDYRLVLLDAPQIIRSLGDVDYGVSFGNHVIAAGRKLSEAFNLEDPEERYQIIIVVREDNLDAKWAKDLEAAYKSGTFREFMESDPDFIGFSTPAYWR